MLAGQLRDVQCSAVQYSAGKQPVNSRVGTIATSVKAIVRFYCGVESFISSLHRTRPRRSPSLHDGIRGDVEVDSVALVLDRVERPELKAVGAVGLECGLALGVVGR